ncbi:DUF6088 family protein [Dyadobacter psychrophilus]|uniref:Transcriptional regulator, AbiEi antitoxin, Type IV TA system n=1 Tax=Dyadobacter psychrophilus TaxID=651661 RepID=A0A1T5H2A3_9BACT|nr:DUF6088 family protein [Dyadobacter psychrophilus]SKC14806.1 Transcriptional regulator, AbiEi antitoxin, Type IV TA system [Dyadobacter psychrophilus]
MESSDDQILERIVRSPRGTLFFPDSFLSISSAKTVAKVLERLVQSGKLHRAATGIYVRPVQDEVIGVILPGIEDIAEAIIRRDKARAVPTGSYALYKLGLTTQVPLNIVYYTDSSSRQVKIGTQTITFKKASARNVSAIGEISKLVIQALRSIGKGNVTAEEIEIIAARLKDEKPYHLQHDIKLAPEWIRQIIRAL